MGKSKNESPVSFRHYPKWRRAGLGAVAVITLLWSSSMRGGRGAPAVAPQAPAPTVSPILYFSTFLQPPRELKATISGPSQDTEALGSGQGHPLTLATEDFNGDGWPDLVAGYAAPSGSGSVVLYFGNREAFSPTSSMSVRVAPLPFLPQARAFDLPEPPELLAVGDFTRDGRPDIVAGARGSGKLYLLAGDGRGGFLAAKTISLPGYLTALAAGKIGQNDASSDLAVGVQSPDGASLLIYKGAWGGLSAQPLAYRLRDVATTLAIGNLDDDPYGDVAMVAGGEVLILHGQIWDSSAANGTTRVAAPELESVSLGFSAASLAIGDFIWDRNDRFELAVLDQGGTVHILARGTPDTRPKTVAEMRAARMAAGRQREYMMRNGLQPVPVPAWRQGLAQPWIEADSVTTSGGSELRTITTALPGAAPQSILLMGGASGQVQLFTKPRSVPYAGAQAVPASWSRDAVRTEGVPVAVLPMRLGVPALSGLVTLTEGRTEPEVHPFAGVTINVDRTDDPAVSSSGSGAAACAGAANDCSLRGAILFANANANTTIDIPAGTYTLTIGENDDPLSDATQGDLDINGSVTIVGAGAATTIIQANFPTADGQDGKIFGVNQDGSHDNIAVSISGVTLEGARNSVGNNDPLFSFTGGAVDYFLTGTSASHTLSGCTITGNTNVHGYGGGVNIDSGVVSGSPGFYHGSVTISNCTITNNQTRGTTSTAASGANCSGLCSGANAVGGGINLFADIDNVTISDSTFSGNATTTDPSAASFYEGGGIFIRHTNGGVVTLTNDTFSANDSASRGGGISIDSGGNQTVSITGGSIINNVSGTYSGGAGEGGGIYIAYGGGATSLNQVSITGNSLSGNTSDHRGGGGIAVGNVTSAVNVSYCRITGNTASGSTGTGLHKDNNTGTVNANENWWGCNAGPGASPCDTAVVGGAGVGTPVLNDTVWLKLNFAASLTTLAVGDTSSLTADFLHDSNGTSVSVANLAVLEGLPITFAGLDGDISGNDLHIGDTTAGEAFANFDATISGHGNAKASVDSQTSQVNIDVTVPITIDTSISGLSFSVDGTPYTSTQVQNWVGGDTHTLATSTPQSGTPGTRYVFNNWSDAGAISHMVTAPGAATTYTATFTPQYLLTTAVSPSGAGTANPASPTFENPSTPIPITATSVNNGYAFSSWTTGGSVTVDTPNSASANATLTGPGIVTANFSGQPTTLAAKLVSSAGPSNTQVFQIELDDTGSVYANSAEIDSVTLTQMAGAACTPVVTNPGSFPLAVGTINPAGNATTSVTVDFSSCTGSAEFNFATTMSANTGGATGSSSTVITLSTTADLTLTKTHTGNFTEGDAADTYTLNVTNGGGGPTANSTDVITLTENLPMGLTATAFSGSGWTCANSLPAVGPTALTCTRADSLAAYTSYPPVILTVGVAVNAPGSVTNTASVTDADGTEAPSGYNAASDPTTVILLPDMAVTKTHTGYFSPGQTGATFTLTARNAGGLATDGSTITLTDILPAGLTATSFTGTGWGCTNSLPAAGPTVLTCTRSDVLNPVSSYPPVTLMVDVDANAPTHEVNTATISGGGGTYAADDSWTDTAFVEYVPTADSVTPNTGTGTSQTFTIQASDSNGFADLRGVSVIINNVLSAGGSCFVKYLQASNTLALANDAGTADLGPVAVGAAGLSNSQCTVNAGSSVMASGNTLQLSLPITFNSGFVGLKNIYVIAGDALGQTHSWRLLGSWTPSADSAPTADSVTPNSGSGSNQTFVVQASDPNGFGDLQWVYMLMNNIANPAQACYIKYYLPTNTLYLLNDAASGIVGSVAVGAGPLSNSQCTLNAGSTVSKAGNTLQLSLPLSFQPTFVGTKNIYVFAADKSTENSGFQVRGTWTPAADTAPTADSVTPNTGSGSSQSFVVQASDANGFADLQWVYMVVSVTPNPVQSCYIKYYRPANTLFLVNDMGSGLAGSATVGGGPLTNSQCTLNAGSTAMTSGNTLQLTLPLTFNSGYVGTKKIYVFANDKSGESSGFQMLGTWTPAPDTAPTIDSITPNAGSGMAQTFTVQASDPDSSKDVNWIRVNFNSVFSNAGGCYIHYSQAYNVLYLVNDAGNGYLGPAPIGTGTLSNSQCTLNTGSAVVSSGNSVQLMLPLTFQAGFTGAKNIYGYATDREGVSSSLAVLGVWTPGP
jgi:FG-GAP repeat